MPMENPFMAYGKGRAFPTGTANRVPTATSGMAVYTHSHNTYYGYYPSDPFLSFTERKRKKNGSAAHGRTVKAALPFLYAEEQTRIRLKQKVISTLVFFILVMLEKLC